MDASWPARKRTTSNDDLARATSAPIERLHLLGLLSGSDAIQRVDRYAFAIGTKLLPWSAPAGLRSQSC